MTRLHLPGINPLDPLGFLAALGVLAATTEDAVRMEVARPRLAFDLGPRPVAILHSRHETIEQVAAILLDDLDRVAGRVEGVGREDFLDFSYEDTKGKPVHDLKPPPETFTRFATEKLGQASVSDRRTLDWLAAVLTDVAVDGSGAGKPFALHFTAGQQRFLNIALELVDGGKHTGVTEQDLLNAVRGPWANDRPLKVFSWSPKQDRAYALRAVDPSSDGKLGTPGADWLAFRGLPLLSSAPMSDRSQTRIQSSGVKGGWKTGSFTYPVWPHALDEDSVRALLRHPALVSDDDSALKTWPHSVERWTCRISRSEQGGYGAFSRPHRAPATRT